MAERIADVPDEADWPELEEELVPESGFMPDAGPFETPFEYLHGARVTLNSDLVRPAQLLTITAARSILRVADETDTPIDPDEREAFEDLAAGEVSGDEDELVDVLARLAAFVERNLTLGED